MKKNLVICAIAALSAGAAIESVAANSGAAPSQSAQASDVLLLVGPVENVDTAGGALTVLGQKVLVRNPDGFELGEAVSVYGAFSEGDTISAQHIDHGGLYVPGANQVLLTGAIDSVDQLTGRIVVGGIAADINAVTNASQMDALRVGDLIQVAGVQPVPGGLILAEDVSSTITTQGISGGAAKGISGGAARGISGGAAKNADDLTTQGISGGATKGISGGAAKGISGGAAKGISGGAAKGADDTTTQGISGGAARGISGGAAKSTDDNSVQGISGGATKGISGGAAKGISGGAAKGISGGAAKDVEDVSTLGISGGATKGISGGASKGISGGAAKDTDDATTQGISGGATKGISGGAAKGISGGANR